MSIGGKFILLGAAVAVVLLVVIYGGGPAPAEGSPPVAVVVEAAPAAAVTVAKKPPPPAKASTRVVSTTPVKPEVKRRLVEPTIQMGKPLSADLVAKAAAASSPAAPRVITPPAKKPASKPTDVKVRSGDTLTSIAERTLGDGTEWRRFVAANPGIDADRLRVGQVLKIPAAVVVKPKSKPVPIPMASRTHRVGDGDTLSSIASDYYGNSQRWSDIFEANRTALGGNPDRLRVDVVLVIP